MTDTKPIRSLDPVYQIQTPDGEEVFFQAKQKSALVWELCSKEEYEEFLKMDWMNARILWTSGAVLRKMSVEFKRNQEAYRALEKENRKLREESKNYEKACRIVQEWSMQFMLSNLTLKEARSANEKRIEELEKELKHWKANHADLKARLHAVTSRTDIRDMEVVQTRLKFYDHLTSRIDELERAAKYAEHIDATPENQIETMLYDTLVERDDLKKINKDLVKKLEVALNRINDMLMCDDGQAYREAQAFIDNYVASNQPKRNHHE